MYVDLQRARAVRFKGHLSPCPRALSDGGSGRGGGGGLLSLSFSSSCLNEGEVRVPAFSDP